VRDRENEVDKKSKLGADAIAKPRGTVQSEMKGVKLERQKAGEGRCRGSTRRGRARRKAARGCRPVGVVAAVDSDGDSETDSSVLMIGSAVSTTLVAELIWVESELKYF